MNRLLFSLAGLICLALSSCSKDESNPSVKDTIVRTVSDGTWKITYFFDNDREVTGNFSGYSFVFGSNGTLTATNGTNTHSGSWSIMSSNSNDDSLDDLDFMISFSSPSAFEELSEDWEILSRTDSKIELRHVSGGNGGTDLLTFGKS